MLPPLVDCPRSGQNQRQCLKGMAFGRLHPERLGGVMD